MPKTSDTFYLRTTKDVGNTNAYHEKELDLGAFVDPLGASVLRIHSVSIVYSDNTGRSTELAANETGAVQWQLATQNQTDIVLASDKSIVSSGRLLCFNDQGTQKLPSYASDSVDLSPQTYKNGYLIGVDTLYFGGSASTSWAGDQYVSIILECTTEKLNKESAVALALSQQ
uniref:Uncharacterized protein n=1 Tax=uncultured marine virus TaxID=186617 RepID=S4TFC8_9VIRU|nr:hypothetical protein [uncultured marine virus]